VADYQELKREVDELVGRINGRYSSPSFMPVVYINQSVARDRLVGLYQAAHVALITPVRDGMNLVALEYVAARGERGGTLILSEFAGAAHCLPGARLVNPYSSSDVANALAHVLEGEGGPSEGFSHMLEFVETNTASRWATSFLARLEETTQTPQSLAKLLDFSRPPLRERALTAKRPLLLLDYDGTLRSFVTDPNDAVPEPRLLDVLRSLTATSLVYVVSGRSAAVLEGWLGKLPIGLVCEHGLAERPPGGSWRPRLEVDLNEILELVGPLLSDFRRNTPGSSIERKQAAVAWHYRGADPEFGAFQANALLPQLEDRLGRSSFKVLRGSRVIEVRHADVSKGRAVEELLERHADSDFVLCAGDDHTDEQMMEAIRGPWRERSITSWVGSPNAHAEYFRESCHKFVGELEALDRLLREARGLPQPAPSRPRSHAGAKASPAARASAQHDSGSPRPR
jgi:trehalose 6-phosphate synthase/phosphatase